MGLLLSIVLTLLVILIGGLYLLGAFRKRRPEEPPLDKGLIPWLGHVLEFRKDTRKFLERMKKKHGNIFTIQLGGHYVTIIHDPLSFGSFVKASREKLDVSNVAKALAERAFGYKFADGDRQIMERASNYLKGDELEIITQPMINHLQDLMLHSTGSMADRSDWKEDGLCMYSCNIVFKAGYLSLYGNEPHTSDGNEEKAKEKDRVESEVLFHEFRKYDQIFPDLAYGILPPKKKMEAEKLKSYFWDALAVQKMKNRDNISPWVWLHQEARLENGMKESMVSRYMFVLLWAFQGNTTSSCFWLLLFLMKHPEAMTAVKGEVDKVLKETGQTVRRDGPLINLTHDMLLKMPILDSAVEETLRLTSAPLITRMVVENMTIKMSDDKEYWLRKGDRVAIFPYSIVQLDPELHPDPLSFKYDRFLNADGTTKTDFYKGGKKVKYYNMPWGVGVSMCRGRFLATILLKQFIFLMLAYLECELENPDERIPDFDTKRIGFGILHPTRDVKFRFRFRV